ncbi:MAG: glycosyltransferase family 2 protein [Holosporales bacterium]
MNKLLTFALPVYNEEATLANTLDEILSQEKANEIEIVISCNCSTDRTLEIAQFYQKQYPQIIRIHRNPENIGAVKNVLVVADLCQTPYIWFFGDDGLFPGALAFVLNAINERSDLGVITLRSITFQNNHARLDRPNSKNIDEAEEVIVTRSLEEYLRTSKDQPYFLSSNIVRKECWNQAMHTTKTCFPHTEIILNIIQKHTSLIAKKIFVKQRANKWFIPKNFESNLSMIQDICFIGSVGVDLEGFKKRPQYSLCLQIFSQMFNKKYSTALTHEQKTKMFQTYKKEKLFLFRKHEYIFNTLCRYSQDFGLFYLRFITKTYYKFLNGGKVRNPFRIGIIKFWRYRQ